MTNYTEKAMKRSNSVRINSIQSVATAWLLLWPLFISPVVQAADEFVFFFTDAQGTAVAAYSESGTTCWEETSAPYGEQLTNDDATPKAGCGFVGSERGYTGHVQDSSGLVYMQQRYYEPTLGRFMSIDPISPIPGNTQSYNRYAYAFNSPYNYTDPTGEISWSDVKDFFGLGSDSDPANDPLGSDQDDNEYWSDPPEEPGLVNLSEWMIGAAKVARATWTAASYGSRAAKQQISRWGRSLGRDKREFRDGMSEKAPTPKLEQVNPRNLVPTQTKSDLNGSQVQRMRKDMKANGFDQSKPITANRNPNTGRLEIQDGHHRAAAAKKAGLTKVPVNIWE